MRTSGDTERRSMSNLGGDAEETKERFSFYEQNSER